MMVNNICGGRALRIAVGITVMVLLKESMAAPATHTDGRAAYIGKG